MEQYLSYIFVMFYILSTVNADFNKNATIENHEYFDRVVCTHNYTYLSYARCSLKFKTRLIKTLHMFGTISKPINNVLVRSTLYYRFSLIYRMFLLDVEDDYCAHMDGSKYSLLLGTIMPHLSKVSNLNHKCPYTGNATVNGLVLGLHLLQSPLLPTGEYMVKVKYLVGREEIVTIKVYFHIPGGKSVDDHEFG